MLKRLSEMVGVALSMIVVLGPAEASIQAPVQCWPDCAAYLEDLQCQNWFGASYYYCGWNNGWTYCCSR